MRKSQMVSNYVKRRIESLEKDFTAGSTKAELAELRRGIGKTPGELPNLWGSFLLELPEELAEDAKHSDTPTYAEWAVYTALTLYALHQQGNAETVNSEEDTYRLGRAVKKLVHSEDDEERIMRRFSAMATAAEPTELAHYLRSIIQLLKAENVKLNYADLACDLYNYQFENGRNNVRLKWGRDYYRNEKKDVKEGEE